jgi:hypothetical protein
LEYGILNFCMLVAGAFGGLVQSFVAELEAERVNDVALKLLFFCVIE